MAQLLREHEYLPVAELCRQLGISEATARRDLTALARKNAVRRTYGGALADYDTGFRPFRERSMEHPEAKCFIAERVVKLVRPGSRIFLDAGSTAQAIASALVRAAIPGLHVVTQNVGIAPLLAGLPDGDTMLLGGRYLPHQECCLGPETERAARRCRIDLALLSAETLDAEGAWNSTPEVVALQRAIMERTQTVALCVDRAKFRRPENRTFLAPPSDFHLLITDATPALKRKHGWNLPTQ